MKQSKESLPKTGLRNSPGLLQTADGWILPVVGAGRGLLKLQSGHVLSGQWKCRAKGDEAVMIVTSEKDARVMTGHGSEPLKYHPVMNIPKAFKRDEPR